MKQKEKEKLKKIIFELCGIDDVYDEESRESWQSSTLQNIIIDLRKLSDEGKD